MELSHSFAKFPKVFECFVDTLKKLAEEQHRLILWTVRHGELLDDAVRFCKQRGLEFYAVNRNYPEEKEEASSQYIRKLQADLWIDDRNVGGLPDWGIIYQMIHNKLTYRDIIKQTIPDETSMKKGFLSRIFKKNRT